MATYFFETMTAARAATYYATTDTIVFTTGMASAGNTTVSPPPPPSPPHLASPGVVGTIAGNMDAAHLNDLFPAIITAASSTQVAASLPNGLGFNLIGAGFVYDDTTGALIDGHASHFTFDDINAAGAQVLTLDLAMPGTSVASFETWLANDQTQLAFSTIFAGDDTLSGSAGADLIRSYAGDDSVAAGAGNDTVIDTSGSNYLRGEDGDDSIQGGVGFDDINGNKGADTIDGGSGGGDWLVGGQGNDSIVSHASNDILYGNLGNDTLQGGTGDEIIRGGQGDDSINGGAGNDWISGDRGNDTIAGGSGADTFHTFSGAGQDVVTDFNASEGDRVQVDVGTNYTLSQVGADTVVDMGNGDQMILKNVQLSSLPQGWIFTV